MSGAPPTRLGSGLGSPRIALSASFALLLALLIAIVSAGVVVSRRVNANANRVYLTETLPLRSAISDLVLQMVNQETGVRGYMISRAVASLEPYTAGARNYVHDLGYLHAHLDGHPQLQTLVARASEEIAAIEIYFTNENVLVESGQAAVARSRVEAGKTLFDRFRATAQSMLDATATLTLDAKRSQQHELDLLTALLVGLGAVALVLGLALMVRVPARVAMLVRALDGERRQQAEAATAAAALAEQAVALQRFGEALVATGSAAEVAEVFGRLGPRLARGEAELLLSAEGGGLVALEADGVARARFASDSDDLAAVAARERSALLLGTRAELEAASGTPPGEGTGALAALPLGLGEELFGVVRIAYPTEQAFTESQRTLLSGMALSLSRALYRAQVLVREGERRARERGIEALTAELSAATSLAEAHAAASRGAAKALGGWLAGVYLLAPDGRRLVRQPGPEGGEEDELALDASSPLTEALRSRQVVVVPSRAALATAYPELAARLEPDRSSRAWAALPLEGPEGPLGAVLVAFGHESRLDDERGALHTVADRLSQAFERAQLHDEEHDIALRLQRSLLPEALVEAPGLVLAAHYQAAQERMEVGGDWYETLALDENRVGLAVGDIVGKGLDAAAAVGGLRAGLQALVQSARGPGATLEGLSRFAEHHPGTAFSTAVYAVLDRTSGLLVYASAGHPPPLLLPPDGAPRFLEEGRSPPLGLEIGLRPEASAVLPPGSTLVLYTDGLVERRRTPLGEQLTRLASLAAALRDAPLPEFCVALTAALTEGEVLGDDVAVLCARLDAVRPAAADTRPGPLAATVPAGAGSPARPG